MLICPLMAKCNIFRTLLLVKLSLQLKDMVTEEISTMKHGKKSCCESHTWQTDRKSLITKWQTSRSEKSVRCCVNYCVGIKKFGYESDLKAEGNVFLAVDKLSQELKIKWKDNTKATKLERPRLDDFIVWLKGQADIYDDCWYPKMSSKFPFQPHKKPRSGGMTKRHVTRPGQQSTLALWVMGRNTSYLLVPRLRLWVWKNA